MLRKRLIFTLIYADDFFNLSRNFRLQKVGNIEWLNNNYNFKEIAFSIDEIIILDASKKKDIYKFSNMVSKLVKNVFIPISAGGGIKSIDQADILFNNGADKLVLNSSINNNPVLIKNLVTKFGSQSIIANIDYKLSDNNEVQIFIEDGNLKLEVDLIEYVDYAQSLGVGEIYLNSISRDGSGFGYDLETVEKLSSIIKVPLIIAGGAGNKEHLMMGLKKDFVDAVATANLFNFIGNALPFARRELLINSLNLANWG